MEHIHWHSEQISSVVCGVCGLPVSKLPSILCAYVSSSIFPTLILKLVEVQLVNASKIVGKLKKTSVTKDAAALSGSITRNWARTHLQEDTADNASRQLQYKRLKIGDPLLGLYGKQQMYCTLCVLK